MKSKEVEVFIEPKTKKSTLECNYRVQTEKGSVTLTLYGHLTSPGLIPEQVMIMPELFSPKHVWVFYGMGRRIMVDPFHWEYLPQSKVARCFEHWKNGQEDSIYLILNQSGEWGLTKERGQG